MFQFTKYYAAESLESAYEELIKNRKNIILGGTSFLRMGNTQYNTAIDLTNLSLNYICEESEFFHIGAMTTFRDLETDSNLNRFFSGMVGKSVENILGVQFRNNVTVGATVFSKYGFSDLIPVLLALDTFVVLQDGGEIPLEDFLLEKKIRRDILVEIKIPKQVCHCSFQTIRKNSADYAVMNLVMVRDQKGKFRIVTGATPKKASIAYAAEKFLNNNPHAGISEEVIELLKQETTFQSNMRASAEYRKAISGVMLKRAYEEVMKK